MKNKKRCSWAAKPIFHKYHDREWGRAVRDDKVLFEFLILEGAQAGLSWESILKRRGDYKRSFFNFNPQKVSRLTDQDLEKILLNSKIIRNRLKVFSARKNALVFLEIQKEFGSFSNYIWQFSNNKIIKNNPKNLAETATESQLSKRISQDLKKRGMSFVGPTIIYAFLQAIGIIDDHEKNCFLN